ncbi:hypothetical protein BGX31_000494 [Mortierella sp. GBA43]|nr:hypothetical protein BGX31_000494 [Mortierella sp. GBA43]
MTLTTQDQNSFKFWGPIAYSRFLLYTTGLILRHTVRHIFGRTPKGQKLLQGYLIQMLKLVMGASVLNIQQSRTMMSLSVDTVIHLSNGTFLQTSKDKWALKTKGQGWEGFWIPFRDQSTKARQKMDLERKVSPSDIGSGCDIVMFAIHGGGMVMGDALMFLGNYRAWMKELHAKYNIKIGILSVEYTLSPEAPYPGALNECVAAYKHLIENVCIDPRRIVMCGDSAGGNLCLTTALKLRDDYPDIGLPAGQVLFSPWVMCPKPLKNSPDDYITVRGGHMFAEAYTQNLAKHQTSPYCSPISAPTLAGMPRMLVFVGGVETLRPSIERFVEKATADGVDLEVHLKEGQAHDYALLPDIAGHKNVAEATQIIGRFVADIRNRYLGLTL